MAIDPGKAQHRVWLSTDEAGLVGEPLSLPVLRPGLEELDRLVREHAGASGALFAVEATGALHRSWVVELNRRFPDCVRVFAPSETAAARAQLGSRRFKTDDRDCAALTYLARQGYGRSVPADVHEALQSAVRHRRSLVAERKAAQQRLHDQVNALCPGLSAPPGHGRKLDLFGVTGQAVLDCLLEFEGRPAAARSLVARALGRLTRADAQFWAARWKDCLPPSADVAARIDRLGRSVERWRALCADIELVDTDIAVLLAGTEGQVLTTLPGVKTARAGAFAAFSMPIARFPSAEHLYSATGLVPGSYESSSITRRPGISRQGLPEHRDALMNIAWGLSQYCPPFIQRREELQARKMKPMQARVVLARHACRLAFRMMRTQEEFDEQRYRENRHQPGR
ncbi:IS110 family RNA-guided transposase [Motilibacter deserti]|uniref:IS110 family transposase n=1 Tax=Motilibacter deserti TaxID=2714956 RepID=A0ABX0H2V9_9ACTN|nr:IS110 family transposase [Motilibacter deserti]